MKTLVKTILTALPIVLLGTGAFAEQTLKIDKNNDNTVTRSEFDSYKDEVFRKSDKNNDGKLDQVEYSSMTAISRQEDAPKAMMREDMNRGEMSETGRGMSGQGGNVGQPMRGDQMDRGMPR